jgi:aspartyl-tRNA(Asn)/glutamyl-tRNA(Gln) amidotransferase subunit A
MSPLSSAEQRVRTVLDQIQQFNPHDSIYLAVARDALASARASDARHAAGAPLSELDGWIVSVKDNIDAAGLPTTAGLGFRRGEIADEDAFAVARLRAAGAIILGKTNMHPAAFGATNRNADFGHCINPLHAGCVPGGSSGGAAASVAAGWADLALGTDTLGSVRIPASYCGVYGVKPSFGLISTRGSVPLCRRLDHVGLMAPTVSALRKGLAIAAAFDGANPDSRQVAYSPVPVGPLKLRAPAMLCGINIEGPVWDAFQRAVKQIESAGIMIERFQAQAQALTPLRHAGLALCEAEMRLTYDEFWRKDQTLFPADVAAGLRWIEKKSARDLAEAALALSAGILLWREWMADADVLLLPTTAHRPFAIESEAPVQQADLTLLANLAGAPALSLPIPERDGPAFTGLQLCANPGGDLMVLDFALTVDHYLNGGVQ